jgi:hypothetical protein
VAYSRFREVYDGTCCPPLPNVHWPGKDKIDPTVL